MNIPWGRHYAVAAMLLLTAQTWAQDISPELAQANVSALPNYRVSLPKHVRYPNGITHSSQGDLYVGSVSNGEIVRLGKDGSHDLVFAASEDIYSVTSLRLDEQTGILWVASPDVRQLQLSNASVKSVTKANHRIVAIDLAAKKILQIWDMPKQGFGNDLTLDGQGGVYVSDSINSAVYHLASVDGPMQLMIHSPELVAQPLGPAGITRDPQGELILGLYSEGSLFRVVKHKKRHSLVKLPLTRALENPDGLLALSAGQLLVLEGAMTSGDGKLSVIDSSVSPHTVTTLVSGIESPLNFTLQGSSLYITESRIRQRLLGNSSAPEPTEFFLRVVDISSLQREHLL